jgi:hypothetical protein
VPALEAVQIKQRLLQLKNEQSRLRRRWWTWKGVSQLPRDPLKMPAPISTPPTLEPLKLKRHWQRSNPERLEMLRLR